MLREEREWFSSPQGGWKRYHLEVLGGPGQKQTTTEGNPVKLCPGTGCSSSVWQRGKNIQGCPHSLSCPPPTPLHVPSLGLPSGPCSWLQRNQNPAYPSLPWPPGAGKQKAASRALMLFLHRVAEEQRETGDTVQEQQLRQLSWRQAFPLPGSFYASYTTPRPTGQLWASRAQSVPSVVIVLREFSMSPEETEQQELWILGSRTGL